MGGKHLQQQATASIRECPRFWPLTLRMMKGTSPALVEGEFSLCEAWQKTRKISGFSDACARLSGDTPEECNLLTTTPDARCRRL
jgi:hypothetical protein